MRRAAITLAEAQSFDRVARAYDRLGDLNPNELIGSWLAGLLPAVGGRALDIGCGTGRHAALLAERFEQVDAIDLSGPMIDLARTRRPRPNITYWQADLHDVGGAGRYDFVLSLLTLHHVPDLHAALSHIKTLLAPGGRAVLMDIYPAEADLRPPWAMRRMVHRVVPLRPRLHALAVQKLSVNLVRRGRRPRGRSTDCRPAGSGWTIASLTGSSAGTSWSAAARAYSLATGSTSWADRAVSDWSGMRRAAPLPGNPAPATEMPSADVCGTDMPANLADLDNPDGDAGRDDPLQADGSSALAPRRRDQW